MSSTAAVVLGIFRDVGRRFATGGSSGDGLLSSSLRTVVTVGGDPFDCDAFLLLLEDRAPRRRLLRVEVRVGVVVAVAVNVVVRRAIFEPIVTHFFPLIR